MFEVKRPIKLPRFPFWIPIHPGSNFDLMLRNPWVSHRVIYPPGNCFLVLCTSWLECGIIFNRN